MSGSTDDRSVGVDGPLLITSVDAAGRERSRLIPRARVDSVLRTGVHASISSVALFTPTDDPVDAIGRDAVIGDLLLAPDAERIARLGERGPAWTPADVREIDGTPFAGCGRHAVRRQQTRLAERGLSARIGFEIEFTLDGGEAVDPSPAHTGPAYGQHPILQNEAFATELLTEFDAAGVPALQLHAEHGHGQFEVALDARDPLDACDDDVLARLVIDRVALRHGLRADFSPIPRVGAASNGMHIHLSLARDGVPLFSPDSDDAPGSAGKAAIAGILAELPALTALLAGSVPSYERLRPGRWSGATVCWGPGNREAAVRYVASTAGGSARGANIEIKPGDASANPYYAVAALLAAAENGIARGAVPPAPVLVSPTRLSEGERAAVGIRPLPSSLTEALAELDRSVVLRAALGDALIDLYLAVRTPHG